MKQNVLDVANTVDPLPHLEMPQRKNVAPLPKNPEPLPVAVRATGNDSNSEQQGNAIPGFKNKKDKQRALAKARDAIVGGSLKPAVRPVAEFCSIGTRGAQWVITQLVEDGVLERTGSGGAARLPKPNQEIKPPPVAKPEPKSVAESRTDQETRDKVIKALTGKSVGFTRTQASDLADKSNGKNLNEWIENAIRAHGTGAAT